LSYSLKRQAGSVVMNVDAGLRVPAGGLVLVWPGGGTPPPDTRINGRAVSWQGTELRIHELPATVVTK
jgi:hypothetical protein